MDRNLENEIDLKDLLVYWALHFRSAIVMCVCAFIVLGMYKGYAAVQVERKNHAEESFMADEHGKTEDNSTITTYQMVVTDDPHFNSPKAPKTYITVTGKDAATGQSIANALIQSMQNNGGKNIVYEITIKTDGDTKMEANNLTEPFWHVFLKNGIIGAVGILFLHLLFFALKYVMSPVIITESQEREVLCLPILGQRRGGAVELYKNHDSLSRILRWSGNFQPDESSIERVDNMVVVNLKLELEKLKQNADNGCRTIMIAGQAAMTDKERLAEMLQKHLEGIPFVIAQSLKEEPLDRSKLLDCNCVLFAEVYGETRKASALEEKLIVQSAGKTVLGSIWG